jgi:predicted O-linked N-acetylglucosamine transferase (SPINDLY family)
MNPFQFVAGLFQRSGKKADVRFDKTAGLETVIEIKNRGDIHGAIGQLQTHLKVDPYNVVARTLLGVCQADVGDLVAARATFELAYSLDDTYIPAVANYARMLADARRSQEALPILRHAKICDPDFLTLDAICAAALRNNGDAVTAQYLCLRGWLANFDGLRFANGYLFNSGYVELDGANLAAEHRFWAETLVHISSPEDEEEPPGIVGSSEDESITEINVIGRKIRIGYWSPDFRQHSVRYFFRPLLENHDRDRVEVFLYHDFPTEDAQTELMCNACDHFFPVCGLNDSALYTLVHSHHLDVIVELAGQSSYNRASLLQQCFATVQLSALGYPPTMGMENIDAKLLDRHVVTDDSSRYYAEAPLILPTSFWCFDPMEDAPINPEPPVERNGFLTYGCVGNIAKITDDVLQCWKRILEQVPKSRLLIRSVSFEDSAAEDFIQARLAAAGISLSAVDVCKPKMGQEFLGSYNEIDVILDTFPYNGGTTTCFATYMGVPVVSWAGNSLISRMGLSILTNLGVPELVVQDGHAYTECAVRLANNTVFLRQFRREARGLFQRTALGNGKLFAREFEDACRELLAKKLAGTFKYQHTIPPLPANEIVRRAYAVLRYGQTDAAERIARHCLRHYPNSGSAHLLITQLWTSENRFEQAVEYLFTRLDSFSEPEQVSVLIYVTRLHLLLGNKDQAERAINRLASMVMEDSFDRMQVELYRAAITPETPIQKPFQNITNPCNSHILIPCNSIERFECMREQISANCYIPQGWSVSYQRCDEKGKIAAYNSALRSKGIDVLILVQKNIALHNPMFLTEVATTLERCDMLGFAGAKRWSRMEWRADEFEHKAAGFMVESTEKAGFVELQLLGGDVKAVVENMAVLDGSLLAVVPGRVHSVAFDDELPGAGLLLEEDWSHAASRSGLRLAVHRNLGVELDRKAILDDRNRAIGRARCAEKMGWDPFAMVKDDHMTLSVIEENAARAAAVSQTFLLDGETALNAMSISQS